MTSELEKKKKAVERIRDLIPLQKELFARFGEQNYNVFVFGSYPTIRYIEGKSDVDIAVYTADITLYANIAVVIEDYFFQRNISVDIFFIDTSITAPIYVAPLKAEIQFTEYYPSELVEFERRCAEELSQIKMRMAG